MLIVLYLTFQLLLFLGLQLLDYGFALIEVIGGFVLLVQKLLFQALVVVCYVDHVQAQSLVVLFHLLQLLFHDQEVSLQCDELHL